MLNYDNKAKVFKQTHLQQQLNNEGFVIVDFLNAEEVTNLLNLHHNKHSENIKGFYTSTFSKDVVYRREVDSLIQQSMQRGLESYFENYRVHCGSFIIKAADEKSSLKLHQDMTLVDESKFTGINIWIPLIDLNKQNGAIEILPKSHRIFKTYRGASLPDIYDGVEPLVHQLLKPCYLKAGQAIIFDQSIIHFSPANTSNVARPVINTFITHKDAEIRICYWDKTKQNEIEIFEQAPDFMVNFQNFGHDIFSRPSIGTSIGFVPFDFPKLTRELLETEFGLTKEKNMIVTETKFSFRELFKKVFNGA